MRNYASRIAIQLVVAVLTAGAIAVLGHGTAGAAGARPLFQLPFRCGEQWQGSTYVGHSPNENSIDFIKVGGGTNGAPILASAAGTISFAGWDNGAGWMVNLRHADGWGTSYFHMIEQPPVSAGQNVAQGQQIGRVGNTGNSSAPHLHYQQWADTPSNTVRAYFNGVPVNIAVGRSEILTSHNCGGGSGAEADLNGDGHADILSVYASGGELVWYPWAGDGFLAGRGLGNAGGFAQFELGDVDSNGRKDMVALLGDGQLVWYPNIGDPNFLAARQVFPSAGGFRQFAMGDVNNDGRDDIVALYHSGELVWYANLGDNTFFRAQQIFASAGGFSMFEVGQMNGVGADDILAVYTSGELVWYPNQANAGPGNPGFLAARHISNAGGFRLFGFADLDRNNHDDVVAVLSSGELLVYTNNGADNFYAGRQVGNAPNFRLMDI